MVRVRVRGSDDGVWVTWARVSVWAMVALHRDSVCCMATVMSSAFCVAALQRVSQVQKETVRSERVVRVRQGFPFPRTLA